MRSTVYVYRGGVVPHCRARFTGSQPGAVVGSLRGSYINNGTLQDLAVLPLQPLTGVTLSALAGSI